MRFPCEVLQAALCYGLEIKYFCHFYVVKTFDIFVDSKREPQNERNRKKLERKRKAGTTMYAGRESTSLPNSKGLICPLAV